VKQILAAKGRGLRCTRLRAVTVEIEKNSDVLSLLSKRPQNGAWIADSHGRFLANSEGRDRPFAG
jgi:hypothetical protein